MRPAHLAIVLLLFGTLASAQAGMEAGILHQNAAAQAKGAPVIPHIPAAAQPAAANAAPAPVPAQAAPEAMPTQELPSTAMPLHVTVSKSVLINTQDELKRVAVTDPKIADAVVVSLHQVMIHGRSPGEVTLILWDTAERSRSFDLVVDVDASGAQREISKMFPADKIKVEAIRSAIVMSGHVASKEDAERAGKVAEAYTKNVVNVITAGPLGNDEILLEVKFAEVDRTAITQLGVNLFSTGAANTFGTATTGQFGQFTGVGLGSVPSNVQIQGTPPGNDLFTGAIGNRLPHQPGIIGANDLLNLSLFRSDINLGAIIKALQQQNLLQILAEPNLIAVDGKDASFLAGGEFPFPVSQGISGAVTIMWKEFGVRLKFNPVIMPNGNIHMRVAPEVSALDFANALTISGFLVPALSTRRAETDLELQDGQSFVIAGLMDNRVTNVMSKMPGIGNVPILGLLFKSKNLQKNKTELMVLVTAHRVSPSNVAPPLPQYPLPFLNDKDMGIKDKKKSGTPAPTGNTPGTPAPGGSAPTSAAPTSAAPTTAAPASVTPAAPAPATAAPGAQASTPAAPEPQAAASASTALAPPEGKTVVP